MFYHLQELCFLRRDYPVRLLAHLDVVETYTPYNAIIFDGPHGTPRILVSGVVEGEPSYLGRFRFFWRLCGWIGVSSTCLKVGVIRWRNNLGKVLIDYPSRRGLVLSCLQASIQLRILCRRALVLLIQYCEQVYFTCDPCVGNLQYLVGATLKLWL